MKSKKVLYVFPVVWMGLIFYFSHQPGVESAQISGWFAELLETIVDFFHLNITGLDLHLLVRKGAHFTVFALLGVLLFIAFYTAKEKLFFSSAFSMIIGAAYGVFDELHQFFIPGRSCQVMDMVIDGLGVLTAVLLCSGYIKLKRYYFP